MISGFTKSIGAYFQALKMIPKYGLWSYLLVPGLISLLLALGIGSISFFLGDDLGQLLSNLIPTSNGDGWLANIWNWINGGLQSIAGWMGSILILAISIILYKNLVIAFIGPFLSPLSEKVEYELTGMKRQSPPFFKSFVRGITLAIRNIIKESLIVAVLFIFGLFPLFSVPAAILIFIVQAYYAGAGNMDFTLERYFNRKESIRFIRNNRGMAIGNGAVFLLLLSIGIGFLIAPPLAAIVGTITVNKKVNG